MVGLKTAFEPPIISIVIPLSVSTLQYYNGTDFNHEHYPVTQLVFRNGRNLSEGLFIWTTNL